MPWRKISALWDIKLSTENRDKPPLIHFFIDTRKFSENRRFPSQRLSFRSCETKKIGRIVMPPSYAWKPSIKEFPWNTTVFSSEIIWFSQTKNFRRKIVITPIMKRVFRYPTFSQTLKDAHEKFRHCVTKNFRRKKVIPPFSSTKLFKTRNFLKTVGLPYKIFRHCETYKFRLKIVICPVLSINFFDIRKFC